MTGSLGVVPLPVPVVSFQYPSNACILFWTLQGSADLVSWVDLGDYSVGCPSGDLEVQATNQMYFYRLKGTQ